MTPGTPGNDWRECPHCGLFSRLPPRQPGLVAICPRCDEVLWRMRHPHSNFPFSCGVAALLFYLFVLVAPFLEIEMYGRFSLARLATGPVQLVAQGWGLVGGLVFAVTLLVPAVKLGILLITLGGMTWMPARPLKMLFRWYERLSPWAMTDVYLLGFLVAYTRLTTMATVHLDTALFALIGFMLAMAAADGSLDIEQVWRTLDARDHHARPPAQPDGTAMGCPTCGMVNQALPGTPCCRCGTTLTPRKPASVSRAGALVLTGALLYIPANLYPFMIITQLTGTQGYTIMGGIVELEQSGLWPLALLVFFASVTIPLLKLLLMTYILLTTRAGGTEHLVGRTAAYRFIDFIGRWSMIDVFMVSILVALVRFGHFANVHAALGAAYFAAVVVVTIFAVEAFDSRLMWDAQDKGKAA